MLDKAMKATQIHCSRRCVCYSINLNECTFIICIMCRKVSMQTHPLCFSCPSVPQNCHNPNHWTSSQCSACPLNWAIEMTTRKPDTCSHFVDITLTSWASIRLTRTERERRSSHLDWVGRRFITRNRVTSTKLIRIFFALPVGYRNISLVYLRLKENTCQDEYKSLFLISI